MIHPRRRLGSTLIALALPLTVGAAVVVSDPARVSGATPVPSDAFAADPARLAVSTAGWKTDFTRASIDLAEVRSGGPPKDGIPAIDAPVSESLEAARGWLAGSAPVIALEVGDQARAYPLAILTWHEIVNDSLGGVPVVVTFCPLCHTALVFERTLDGVVHDFGTTGNLRHSDLVMYDRQTETWWQQATGHAIAGALTGRRLTFLPAQITSLDAFAATWPAGDVLSRDTGHQRDYGRNPYPGYDTPDEQPFLYEGRVDDRIAPKERVVSVGEGGDAIAFAWTDLAFTGSSTRARTSARPASSGPSSTVGC